MHEPSPTVEPSEHDVDLAVTEQQRLGETGLRRSVADDTSCGSCRHYLDADAPIAYCWHPTQRTLVDAAWVCDQHAVDTDR